LWAGGAQARAATLRAQAVAAPAQARAAALPARAGAMPAGAARVLAAGVADPSVDGKLIALHRPGGVGELRSPQQTVPAPGPHPAVGGGHLAWVGQGTVEVQGLASYPAPGADAVAVSRTWVAWRAGTALHAARIGAAPRVVATGAVSRPALDGSRLVFAVAGRIDEITLASGRRRTLRREARVQLRGPSALGGRLLLYVRADYRGQQLMLGRLRPRAVSRDRVLYGTVPTGGRDSGADPGREHAPGHNPYLWPRPRPGVADTLTTTALAHRAAYVTRVRQVTGRPVTAVVLRIAR
jgi:hypothetical protein